MTPSDLTLVMATLAGPVLAVQAQKWIERSRAKKERREAIFKALMATRGGGALLSPSHVEALNMIELEFRRDKFGGDKFRDVRDAWKTYLDHLNAPMATDKSAADRWQEKRTDLLTALLSAMGRALGHEFATVDIKNGWYAPMQHLHDDVEQRQLRGLLLKALKSGALAVEVPAPEHGPVDPPRLKGE